MSNIEVSSNGHGAGLPLPSGEAPVAKPALAAAPESSEALVEIIRHSRDPERRRAALAELEGRGWIETL